MTTQEILNEIVARAGDPSLQADVLLTKVNAEYDQTNLEIMNLNEDYFYDEQEVEVTSSVGPYEFPEGFGKLRGLFRPDETLVPQRRPTDRKLKYGWYLAGTDLLGTKLFKFTDTPDTTGDYIVASVNFPTHLNVDDPINPVWPAPFHELLVIGGLERLFSIEDLWQKHADLMKAKKELRAALLAQVGGLNLGTNRTVQDEDGSLEDAA